MARQYLELFGRIVGRRIPNKLHLVEFVGSQDAACVLARRPRFASEAGRIGDEAFRQHVGVQDLVPIQIRDGDLGGRNEKELIALHGIGVILELRQLTGAGHRRPIHEKRGPGLLVTVLVRVQVDKEVYQCPNESSA